MNDDRRPKTIGEQLLQEMMMTEALHSVALSHEENCGCEVCRLAEADSRAAERMRKERDV